MPSAFGLFDGTKLVCATTRAPKSSARVASTPESTTAIVGSVESESEKLDT